jgi:hypothetical protein
MGGDLTAPERAQVRYRDRAVLAGPILESGPSNGTHQSAELRPPLIASPFKLDRLRVCGSSRCGVKGGGRLLKD